jgi:hypothetical protein
MLPFQQNYQQQYSQPYQQQPFHLPPSHQSNPFHNTQFAVIFDENKPATAMSAPLHDVMLYGAQHLELQMRSTVAQSLQHEKNAEIYQHADILKLAMNPNPPTAETAATATAGTASAPASAPASSTASSTDMLVAQNSAAIQANAACFSQLFSELKSIKSDLRRHRPTINVDSDDDSAQASKSAKRRRTIQQKQALLAAELLALEPAPDNNPDNLTALIDSLDITAEDATSSSIVTKLTAKFLVNNKWNRAGLFAAADTVDVPHTTKSDAKTVVNLMATAQLEKLQIAGTLPSSILNISPSSTILLNHNQY